MGEVVDLHRGKFSGGELPHDVDNVWAMAILTDSDVGHFYKRTGDAFRSRCGRSVVSAKLFNGQCRLFGIGSFGRCEVCKKPRRGVGSY
jgi:hypothetical protein